MIFNSSHNISFALYPEMPRFNTLTVIQRGSIAGKSEEKHDKSKTEIPHEVVPISFLTLMAKFMLELEFVFGFSLS